MRRDLYPYGERGLSRKWPFSLGMVAGFMGAVFILPLILGALSGIFHIFLIAALVAVVLFVVRFIRRL